MQNFRRILTGIDTAPFLNEIASIEGIWYEQTGRQTAAKVQREAFAIPIRGLRKSAQGDRARRDVHESRWTTGSSRLPHTREFLEWTAMRLQSEVSRAKIVNLPPGGRVYPHIDRGEYYRYRDRYHLVLRSPHGSWLRAGDETVRMAEGELWWFDNKEMHEAMNDGDADRIHFIFDLLPDVHKSKIDAAVPAKAVTPADNTLDVTAG